MLPPENHRSAAGRLVGPWLALALLPLLAACRVPHAAGPDVMARVGGEEITHRTFEAYLHANVDGGEEALEPTVLSRLFDQLLDERLLYLLARAKGRAGAVQEPRQAVDQLLRQALEAQWNEGEVAAFYAAHRGDFERPERVHLRQILVHDRETAEEALAAIHRGEPFTEVAARLSIEPRAEAGGDQGVLERGDLPQPFQELVFRLAQGEVSDVASAPYGFHIFQVVERYPAEVQPLAEVAGEIRQLLVQQRIDRLTAAFLDEARGRYNVEIYRDNFPFDYRGTYAG